MAIPKERVWFGVNIQDLMLFLTLFGVAVLIPALLHVQWITGSLVNAIFILTLFLLGLKRALAVAFVPSLIALSSGTLPIGLAPAIPFIIAGNAAYILAINYFQNNLNFEKKNYWLSIFLASGLKFSLLFISANLLLKIFSSGAVAMKISQMLTWTQFLTAILCGMIAAIILKKMSKL